ncbi:hypothetical protein [Sphingomonas jaspsi]|uniref:hypothetical protein n=1 Tax=Sphingomonas jaspsi TaxID=392409 RepID=UPI000568D7BF|nr:hypothetical protein [Sphingomonas jaspsi]
MQLAVTSPAVAANVRRELGSRLITFAERWFDIPQGSIQNPKRRNGNISRARWAVAHVLNTEAGWSQPKIAKLYGCDPSSIHTGWRRARELLRNDAIFFDAVERLQKEITTHA